MRHASIFTGIGGFDLAAEWMGWENVMQCEIDPFCQKVLRHHFPSATLYGDIKQLDGNPWRGKIDILTGGFPCQPFSHAGERRGTEDNRYLWPEMLRVIREIQPAWIVAENVRGLLTLDEGVVLETIRSEMETLGYECQPILIPACAVSAPHRRDRVWFIANHPGKRLERCEREIEERDGERFAPRDWDIPWPDVAARLCRVDDGLPRELDGITVPRWRRESLRAYGNAIVPQVAYRIFQSL